MFTSEGDQPTAQPSVLYPRWAAGGVGRRCSTRSRCPDHATGKAQPNSPQIQRHRCFICVPGSEFFTSARSWSSAFLQLDYSPSRRVSLAFSSCSSLKRRASLRDISPYLLDPTLGFLANTEVAADFGDGTTGLQQIGALSTLVHDLLERCVLKI